MNIRRIYGYKYKNAYMKLISYLPIYMAYFMEHFYFTENRSTLLILVYNGVKPKTHFTYDILKNSIIPYFPQSKNAPNPKTWS